MQVGAGPLEDLLHEHGAELVGEVERRARRNPLFRQALGAVWLEQGALEPDVLRRLEVWRSPPGGGWIGCPSR